MYRKYWSGHAGVAWGYKCGEYVIHYCVLIRQYVFQAITGQQTCNIYQHTQ